MKEKLRCNRSSVSVTSRHNMKPRNGIVTMKLSPFVSMKSWRVIDVGSMWCSLKGRIKFYNKSKVYNVIKFYINPWFNRVIAMLQLSTLNIIYRTRKSWLKTPSLSPLTMLLVITNYLLLTFYDCHPSKIIRKKSTRVFFGTENCYLMASQRW